MVIFLALTNFALLILTDGFCFTCARTQSDRDREMIRHNVFMGPCLISYHFAVGYILGRACISARIYARCSVWMPLRLPVCMNTFSGLVSVAL